jgi:hypothetical protein
MLEFTDINKSLPNGQNMGGLTQEIYFGFHADILTWPTGYTCSQCSTDRGIDHEARQETV